MFKQLLFGVLAIASAGLAFGPLAHADNMWLGLSESGYSPFQTSSATGSIGISDYTYGSFFAIDAGGTSSNHVPSTFPDLLNTHLLNYSTSSSGTLTVWLTATDLTQPVNITQLLSGFTTNIFQSGWTVQENVYYDTSNGLDGGTLLASANFSGSGLDISKSSSSVNVGGGPWSLTEEYIISANGSGSANSTINTYVPEPSGLGILGLGLSAIGALGWIRRRRRQNKKI